jgi:hypothetical protein
VEIDPGTGSATATRTRLDTELPAGEQQETVTPSSE